MEDCVFCRIVNGELPCMKVYEDDNALAFMDIVKDVDGHIVVIPKVHVKSILDCDEQTLSGIMNAVKKIAGHLTDSCGYTGVNLLNASGGSAGQSVGHFPIHIVPRKDGDGIDAWPRFEGSKRPVEEVFAEITML